MRIHHLTAALVAGLLAVGAATAALAANDPYRSQQWNVDRIEAPLAWELSRGSGIRVAIVDTGVDLRHPDLIDRIARRADGTVIGRDFVDNDGDPSDENGHGTLVAGIVAASLDNGIGIAGIAPAARIMPIRVLDANGSGRGEDVDAAIRWAVDNGAHVVNLSLESVGSAPSIQLPIAAPTSAVRYAWDRGVVVVAASGNDSSRSDDYPANSPIVLVGATTRDDRRASFSDTGRTDALMAPGVDIISTWWCDPSKANCPEEHTYGEADGTSFAAPHVSGAVAVLRALGLSHTQAVQRLRDTARDIGAPGPDDETGYGLIDLAAAAGARNPPSSPSPSPTGSPSPRPSPTSGSPSPSPTDGDTPTPAPDDPSTEPTTSPTPPVATSPATEPAPTVAPSATTSPDPSPTDALPGSDTGASAEANAGASPVAAARTVAASLLAVAIAGHVAVRRRDP